MATAEQKQQLVALTTMMFNAPPGATFLAEFEGYLDQGLSLEQIAINLANTDAFNAQFSGMTTDKEKIDLVLSAAGIDESSDAYAEAYTHFEQSLANGVSPGALLQGAAEFLTTTEDESFSAPSATFRNKVEAGVKHSIELGLSSENLDELKSAVEGVTDDPATLIQKEQELEEQAQQEQGNGNQEEETNNGGGSGSSGTTFTVTVTGGEVMFGGTDNGVVTLTTDGTNLTFTWDGIEATTKPAISTINAGGIPSVSMTASTHSTTNLAAKLGGEVTLTDAFSGTGGANARGYVLADVDGSQFTLGAADQNVTTGSLADTINVAGLTATGKLTTVAVDTISMGNGADIKSVDNASNVTGGALAANNLTLADNASVTMTAAQNNAFSGTITAGASETITISDTANADALKDIENYTLASAGELTVTSANTAVNVTGKADTNETVNVGGLTVNGTYALGTGTDVLTADTGANISGVNGGSATTAEDLTLADNASVTMTAEQHGGFTGTITAGAGETITLSNAGTVTGFASVESYVLASGSSTFTLGSAAQNVDASTDGQDTIDVGILTATGKFSTAATDTISMGDGADIKSVKNASDVTGGALAANNLKLADNASVTMSAAQNNAFSGTITAGATETITISDTANADALKDIENYTLASAGELTVTSANTAVDVTGKADTNETVNVGGLTVNGTYALGTGTDVLTADTGANISGVNKGSATTAEDLTLTSGAAVTMTAAQNNAFSGTITAAGSETITLSDAGTITGLADVEAYVLADGTNDLTVNSGVLAPTVTGGTGADTIRIQGVTLTGGTLDGLGGTDTLVVRDGTNLTASTLANLENLTFDATGVTGTNDVTMNQVQHQGFVGGTINASGTDSNGENITVTTAGVITAFAGVENYSVSSGGSNSIIVNASTPGMNITGAVDHATTVNTAGVAATGNYSLDNGADILISTNGGNITAVNSGAATTAEILNIDGTVTMTAAQYGGFSSNMVDGGAVAQDEIQISDQATAATVGANQSVVETICFQSNAKDTVAVTTGTAGEYTGIIDIAAGGNDRVNLNNVALDDTATESVTIIGFTNGASADTLGITFAGTAQGPGYQAITGANETVTTGVNSIVELEGSTVTNLADIADVKTFMVGQIGDISDGNFTAVIYDGTDAGIYNFTMTDGDSNGTLDATSEIGVELIGIVDSVTADSFEFGNFA